MTYYKYNARRERAPPRSVRDDGAKLLGSSVSCRMKLAVQSQ